MFGNKVGHLGRVGSLTLAQRVSAMFSRGEPGAWYDPSDLSTLFQDAAGTIPVTAVEQPVGRMLDKSGRGNHATQATTTKRPVLQQDANGCYYLRFDGVDDALQTGNIDFTSTDKMTAWAGVLRASTSLGQEICGLTASPVNAGAFTLWASTGADAGVSNTQAAFSSAISGSLRVAAQTLTHNTQAVLNGYQNSTGVNARLNSGAINTVAAIPVANFANAPIYIGSRAGTSIFFNGRIYSLIVRGAQTPLSQIEATELYIKQKMRMP